MLFASANVAVFHTSLALVSWPDATQQTFQWPHHIFTDGGQRRGWSKEKTRRCLLVYFDDELEVSYFHVSMVEASGSCFAGRVWGKVAWRFFTSAPAEEPFLQHPFSLSTLL